MERTHHGPAREWTKSNESFFVDHADLYVPFLESALQRGDAEADALAGIFGDLGIPKGGSVMDLGCGIGRHSIPLAEAGYRVLGIDISPTFVKIASDRARELGVDARASHMVADTRDLPVGYSDRRFHAFISMFTSVGLHGEPSDVRLFESLKAMAEPGAVLVVDTANRDWIMRNFNTFGSQKAGKLLMLQERGFRFDSGESLATWSIYEELSGGDLKLHLRGDISVRLYCLHEVKAMVEKAGWTYVRAYGTSRSGVFQLGDFGFESHAMWVVACNR